jgi:hypothetical protein
MNGTRQERTHTCAPGIIPGIRVNPEVTEEVVHHTGL